MPLCSCLLSLEDRQSRDIDGKLKKDAKFYDREIKLLLLGTGESGKSTIVKQMKILYLDGFKSDQERKEFTVVVYGNVLQSAKTLCKAVAKFGLKYENPESETIAEAFLKMPTNGQSFTPEIGANVVKWWKDSAVQTAYERRSEFQLNDSTHYYFSDMERLMSKSYVPDVQDVLQARVTTTGIQETLFEYKQVKFRMVDVGGQRNERRKWIHCFQEVTAIIFCVAVSEYDQTLYEDETQNRMVESLLLFDEICNSRWFAKTSLILFLNKKDLFQQKIKNVDLKVCFPEYDGGCNYDKAIQFIKKKFVALNRNPDAKRVYAHETCATDTRNIKFVFEAVRDIIITANLATSGL